MDVLSLMNYLRVFCGQTAGSFLRELNCATIHFLQSNEIINDHIASFSCFYIFFRSILFSCKSIYRWSFRPHTQKKRKKLLLLLYRLGILIFFFGYRSNRFSNCNNKNIGIQFRNGLFRHKRFFINNANKDIHLYINIQWHFRRH